MTFSANDEWDYDKLQHGISLLEDAKLRLKENTTAIPSLIEWGCRDIQHAIDFIEWNMRELEITGGNGD
jgi:hypothetical protein